jgi:hypothetical protein
MTPQGDPSQGQGRRAEEVASWYFRLNGFLQIPGFVLHSDQARRAITDADLLGVRFPYSQEFLRGIRMTDDRWLSETTSPGQTLFVIAEVKTSLCHVNGPWTNRQLGGMEKVIRRIGFAREEMIQAIADSLYNTLHWQNDDFIVQYVAMGDRTNHELTTRYRKLKQLTWPDVASFIHERFSSFGDVKGGHSQWPTFGREFARAVQRGRIPHLNDAAAFVSRYIESGECGSTGP